MLNAPTCFLHAVISQLLFSKACDIHSNSVQQMPMHALKITTWQFLGKRDPNTWQNPPPFLQSHLISAEPDLETCVTLAPQGGKTQTSAGLLFFLRFPWGCPVLSQVYFVNVWWDLISCLHSPYLVAVVTNSLRLCTFISSQGKAVWENLHPNWVEDEHGYSEKSWDKVHGRGAGWDT